MEPKYLKIDYVDRIDMLVYNGKECNFETNPFPLTTQTEDGIYDANTKLTIDIDSGEVLHWPKGNVGVIMSKPVDSGIYTFLDEHNEKLTLINDYVIDGLDIDDDGFGDYIYITIQEDGTIKNWDKEKILNAYNEHLKDYESKE